MRDTGPGHTEDAGITHEWTTRKLRQLPIEARGKVLVDLANLVFHQMVVVHEPIGGRGDSAPVVHRGGNRAINPEQDRFVILETVIERPSRWRPVSDALCARQRCRMLFEAFYAEQLFADDFVVLPRRCGRFAGKESAQQ